MKSTILEISNLPSIVYKEAQVKLGKIVLKNNSLLVPKNIRMFVGSEKTRKIGPYKLRGVPTSDKSLTHFTYIGSKTKVNQLIKFLEEKPAKFKNIQFGGSVLTPWVGKSYRFTFYMKMA